MLILSHRIKKTQQKFCLKSYEFIEVTATCHNPKPTMVRHCSSPLLL